MNVKVSNLMSRVNEARYVVQHESPESKCGSSESVCNSQQKWTHNECRCECKHLDDWRSCEKGYMWNHSKCNCKRK